MISIYNSVDCASWEIKNLRKKPRVKIERISERTKIYKTSHGLMNLGYRREKWERESTEESTWRLSKDRKSNSTRFQIKRKSLKNHFLAWSGISSFTTSMKMVKMTEKNKFLSAHEFASNTSLPHFVIYYFVSFS